MAKKPVKKKTRTKKPAPDKELARAAERPRTWSVTYGITTLNMPLTLRQWYAGQALGLVGYRMDAIKVNWTPKCIAHLCLQIADEMVKSERKKVKETKHGE